MSILIKVNIGTTTKMFSEKIGKLIEIFVKQNKRDLGISDFEKIDKTNIKVVLVK